MLKRFLCAIVVAFGVTLTISAVPASATVTNYPVDVSPVYCGNYGDVIDMTIWFAIDSSTGQRKVLSAFAGPHYGTMTWIETKALPVVEGVPTTDGPTHYGNGGSFTGSDKNTAALWASRVNVTAIVSVSLLDGATCEVRHDAP